jgi:virginiamycin B lyase
MWHPDERRTRHRGLLFSLALAGVLLAWPLAAAPNPHGTPPGHGGTPPGQGGTPPGQQGNGLSTFAEFDVPTANSIPLDIVLGPDGFIWFTEFNSGNFTKASSDGTMVEYAGPIHVTGITAGGDGNLWLTDPDHNSVLQVDPSKGKIKNVFPVAAAGEGIAKGSDNALWFAEPGNSRIGRVTTSGIVTHYNVPSGGDPKTIRLGPDGNLWFTEFAANKIARLTTTGTFTEFSLPAGANPTSLCSLGTDVWFTEFGTNTIARIATSAPNTITRYVLPAGRGPRDCAGEPSSGTVYFTEATSGGVGQIDAAGNLSELDLTAQDRRITLGNDGAMWITEPFANRIARLPLDIQLPN